MKEQYQIFYEILQECQWDCELFLQKTESIACEEKAMILLKIGSSYIKQRREVASIMEKALQMLEEKSKCLGIQDAFLCALGYEKIENYKKAILYYEYCIQHLPASSMKLAMLGMKYRVYSKMNPEEQNFDLAIEAFSRAEKEEIVSWRKEKWKVAQDEMVLQKERKWKLVVDDSV